MEQNILFQEFLFLISFIAARNYLLKLVTQAQELGVKGVLNIKNFNVNDIQY